MMRGSVTWAQRILLLVTLIVHRGGLKRHAGEATCTVRRVKRCGLRVIVTWDCGIATWFGASRTWQRGF